MGVLPGAKSDVGDGVPAEDGAFDPAIDATVDSTANTAEARPYLNSAPHARPLQAHSDALVESLTSGSELVLFSYSIRQRALVYCSGNVARVLGVSTGEVSRDGNLFLRHLHPDDRFTVFNQFEQALHGSPYSVTYRWLRPDTEAQRWLHCRAALRTEAGNEMLEGFIVDLTPVVTSLGQGATGPDSPAAVFSAFPNLVFTLDKDLRLLRVNRPRELGGFTFGDDHFHRDRFKPGHELLSCFSERAHAEHFRLIAEDLLQGRRAHHRTRVTTGAGVYSLELSPIHDQGVIHGLLGVITEIDTLVKLERQLSELRRTEGLRVLAAGIAHNFNNSLQSIVGHAAAMMSHPERKDIVIRASEAIIEVVNRASELTKQLFVAEDHQRQSMTPVDLNLAAMAAVNRVSDLFTSGLSVAVVFGNPEPVLGKQEQLTEAIEALLRNAKESTPPGGTMAVKTSEVELAELEIEDLRAGVYAKLTISDSGAGMVEGTVERCKEPFFSTKESDPRSGISLSGKGLGLTKTFNVVREHGGALQIESHRGFGTTISIYIPVRARGSTQLNNIIQLPEQGAGTEVLIVDDDAMVLETVAAMLRDGGYRCVTAEDSSRALTLVKSHARHLKLVILDAIMPGTDGPALLREVKKICPALEVVGFSGAHPAQVQPLLDAGALEILRKPIDPKSLRQVVGRVVGAPQALGTRARSS